MYIYLNNHRGRALVYVLIVLVVLSVLGVALLNLGLFENRSSIRSLKKVEAYYLAKSGAYSTAKHLMSPANSSVVDTLISAAPVVSEEQSLGNGSFRVTVSEFNLPNIAPRIKIESVGSVPYLSGTITEKETVIIEKITLFNSAVFASGNINNASNSFIDGNVEAGGTITNPNPPQINSPDPTIQNSPRRYPDPIMPNTIEFENKFGHEYPGTYPTNLHMENHPTLFTLWDVGSDFTVRDNSYYVDPNDRFGDYKYDQLKIGNNRTLTFDISSDLRIYLRAFDNNTGNVYLRVTSTGPTQGRLFIYVDEIFKFKGEIIAPPEAFYLIGANGATIEMQTGSQVFNGYIYAPGANVEYKSGTYSGAIICNDLTISSGGSVNYNGSGLSDFLPEELGLDSFGYKMGLWGNN